MTQVNSFYESPREKSQMDIIDYSYLDLPFENFYEKDSRIEKYHNAYVIPYPELKNWSMSGHYINPNLKLGGTRKNCGQIRGVKKSKSPLGNPKPLINSCGKLQCKVCYRESSSIKTMKIQDHLDSVLYRFMFDKVKFTRSRTRNLDFKHVSLNLEPVKKKTRNWDHLLKYFENYEIYLKEIYLPIKKIVSKYFIGAVIQLHLYRFWDQEQTVLFFSPHFHVVGIGYLPHWKNFIRRHSKSIVKKGLNYWNMKNKETGLYLLSEKKDIVNALKYVLSHAGLYMYDRKQKMRQNEKQKESNDPVEYTSIKASKIAYHYVNLFSPQKYKVKKEFKYKVSQRDENNDLFYEVIDGFIIKGKSVNGLEKIILPNDLFDVEFPINFYVTDSTQIYLDHDRLKFGARIKMKKRLKVLLDRS